MLIETVLMRQHYGLSVCVTTQVGCNIGCTFCASGLIKKQRDLTAGEIVAQIMLVQKYFDDRGDGERVSHVVVMGIGEPFDNYDNVLRFLRTINNDNGLAIGARHITVSTSGLAPKLRNLPTKVFKLTSPYHFTRLTMTFVQASCVLTAHFHLKNSLKLLNITSRQPTVV